MKYEVYETDAGNPRWRLVGGNGQEVANGGENFSSRSAAKRAAEAFKANAARHDFSVYESGTNFRWRAVASNGQIVGVSGEPFPTRSNAQRAARNVQDNAGSADGP